MRKIIFIVLTVAALGIGATASMFFAQPAAADSSCHTGDCSG